MMLEQVFIEGVIASFLAAMVRFSIPILYVSLGEVFAERSGVLNVGVEGIMQIGAVSGFTGYYLSGNPLVGVLAAVIAGAAFGLISALFYVKLKADQIVAGFGIWFLGIGLSSFIYRIFFPLGKVNVITIPNVEIPFLSQIPVIGDAFFNQSLFGLLILFLGLPIATIILFHTTFGLNITAVGESPDVADALGVNPDRVRQICVIIGGIMASLGGAYLTVSLAGVFGDNITAGLGFVAIAMVMFGRWSPWRIVAGTFLYSGIYALQLRLQVQTGLSYYLPFQFLLMLPYVLVIVALVAVTRKRSGTPAALGTPYRKGEK
jgi:simple sugar transport system permease protein